MSDVIDRMVLAMNNHDLDGAAGLIHEDGVTLFQIRDDQIVAGRLYMEDVDREGLDIDRVVLARSGRRPQMPTD